MRGPRLLALLAIAIAALVTIVIATSPDPFDVDTASRVTRWTARSSLVLFLLAYIARPAVQVFRAPWAKRLLAERKWIGLGFATSHLAHLGGIVAVASPDFGEFLRGQPATNIIAAITFVLLFAMAITSIDAVKTRMPAARWKLLHSTGMRFAWLAFAATYAAAIPRGAIYAVPTALLLAAAGVRVVAWIRLPARRAATS